MALRTIEILFQQKILWILHKWTATIVIDRLTATRQDSIAEDRRRIDNSRMQMPLWLFNVRNYTTVIKVVISLLFPLSLISDSCCRVRLQ